MIFLSLEHLQVIVGLLSSLIVILLCLKEQRDLRRETEMGKYSVDGAFKKYTFTDQVHCLWVYFMVPQNSYNSNVKDHQSEITIRNMIRMKKSLKYYKNYQNVMQRHKMSKYCWKMVLIGLLWLGFHKPLIQNKCNFCKVQLIGARQNMVCL